MPPRKYSIGDSLNWQAAWKAVTLWTELPFWLMVPNTKLTVEHEAHHFPFFIHDNYWEFFIYELTDSRTTVLYRGPRKESCQMPLEIRKGLEDNPECPTMWRKCKTVLKIESRCNEDVWNAFFEEALPRKNEAALYLSELCRAHIPVVNSLIRSYRLSTYDYFAFEVSPWDVPNWCIESDEVTIKSALVGYREWDGKPLLFKDPQQEPAVYNLIGADDLQQHISDQPNPGELELMDALNQMEKGDYSSAVRRITTAIEVIVETKTKNAVETRGGKQAAEKFILNTRMNFNERVKMYQKLSGRSLPTPMLKDLDDTRKLRHSIVHGGCRIEPHGRATAQRAVDTGRWIFNWFENDQSKFALRERTIGLRSLGRDLSAGIFNPKITTEGVVLSPPTAGIKGNRTSRGRH